MNFNKPVMKLLRLAAEPAMLENADRVGPGSVKDHLYQEISRESIELL
jgi:hypothetical protein